MLKPLLLESFHPFLEASYRALFGPELGDEALAFRHHALSRPFMLRRPGYRLKPHRDMKIAALTGLICLAVLVTARSTERNSIVSRTTGRRRS